VAFLKRFVEYLKVLLLNINLPLPWARDLTKRRLE
jgi:hypothetical protein